MSRRTSFHISEQAEKIVAENGDQAKRINFLITACSELQESPAFTEQEWMILVAAGNGFVPAYSAGLDAILHSFASGIAYAAIFGSEYENIDKEELARNFYALQKNEQLFVFELARKFWLPTKKQMNSYAEWLIENGAKIT